MSYKLLRTLLILLAAAALVGFGLTFYDFLKNKEVYLAPFDLRALDESFEVSAKESGTSHLRPWETHYQRMITLDYAGKIVEEPVNSTEVKDPPPTITASDVEVCYVQLGVPKAAWIRPRQPVSRSSTGENEIAGGFYIEGDTFPLESKPGLKVEVVEIRLASVDVQVVGDPDSRITLANAEFEVDAESLGTAGGPPSGHRVAPVTTRMTQPSYYEVGTEDFDAIAEMPEDEIYAAVRSRPERDPASGEVRGLRIVKVNPDSVFSRQGMRDDDLLLDVNGFPVKDRAELLQYLRREGESGVATYRIRFERAGGVRVHTYRLPPR